MPPGDADLAKLFHDLRSPLTAITGAFSVVEACCEDLEPHVRRAVEAGLRASDAMDARLRELEARLRTAGPRALDILVAEDLEDNRMIFQAYLARTPHRVVWAEDGAEAVERFRVGRFDLVLMDMQMPVMDGYAATRAVRAWERERGLAPTPIVALTASALGNDVAAAEAAGCTGHLTKPITRGTFLSALAAYA